MSDLYERAPERGPGIRLHLNENTAGCSPSVLEAIRLISAAQASAYPDYGDTYRACASWLGVRADELLITNGLDEGIYTAAVAWLQRGRDGAPAEAVVVEPAYALFAASAEVMGARVVRAGPRPDFGLPLEETLAAITPATRMLFLASPANPSGRLAPCAAVEAMSRRLPPGAVLFLDEAYVEFASASFLERLRSFPNVVLGRTFAKAYGLAAVRAGYVVAASPLIEDLRRVVLPFSVNVFALAAIRAAIGDDTAVRRYVDQVAESRRRLYAMCDRLGFEYWPSEANFVLVRVGSRAPDLVEALAARGIYVRDRSTLPGCDGCLRITAGLAEHADACVAAVEELCAGQ
jgi:histidinol-phosphate aminotransferase